MRTVDIPGGQVTLRDAAELNVRQRRRIEVIAMQLGPVMSKLEKVTATSGMDDLDLSEHQASLVFDLQDATILSAVASWTLDRPIPTAETVGDLDVALYDALAAATATLVATVAPVDFSPSANPEDGSPTGGSDGSDG